MKVSHLKQGMLLTTKSEISPRVQSERVIFNKGKKTIKTLRFQYSPLSLFQKDNNSTFIYLGYAFDSYLWDRTKKHHRVLFNGVILHMSGYDMKFIESVAS